MSGVARAEPVGPSHDDGARILHVDMDAFFAAVELIDRPDLRGQPVIVGGSGRGVVLSATYEARRHGVRSAMPMARARALCPQAVVLPPQRHRYVAVSGTVMTILAEITPLMEQVSIDEAFLDVSGARRRLGTPMQIAVALRERIRREADVVASVGIGATKTIAKLASTRAKPDGLLHVPADETVAFLHRLEVGELWGVGARTRERLHRHGIDTVAELAGRPVTELHRILGHAAGQHVHDLARGIDPRRVQPDRPTKSVGTETTFESDIADREALDLVLLGQAHACARRLRAGSLLARTVAIKARYADFRTVTRSRSLAATDVAREIHGAARELLAELPIPPSGLRLLGVRVESLVGAGSAGRQLSLDGTAHREAEGAMDAVRQRFGEAALRPGSLLAGRSDSE